VLAVEGGELALGRAALDRGELGDALAKFRRAVELQPDSSNAQQYLGTVLEKQGDTNGAIAAYRKALELNPGATAVKQRLDALTETAASSEDATRVAEFEGYIREGRFKEVEPLLAAYVKERPSSSWAWYALGYSLFGQQKIGESIRALAKSLELDLRNAEAHKILGRNLMIIGRFDAAQIEFEQAIRYKPDSAESYYNLGKLFSVQDNWESARTAFEAALRIDPSYVEAMDAQGFALEALGDNEGAVAMYRKAIAINEERHGTYAPPHVNLSAYYNRTGDPEKALEHAGRALALDPKSDRALFQQGRAYERQGKLEQAAQALNEAIVLNPRASSYYYVLAGVYRRLGWMEENRKALEVFQKLERESAELEKKRRAAGSKRD
jgi:tetratricopeptide (TPR) repeat protein